MQLIILSIPIFLLLLAIELIINYVQKTGYYRLNDSIANISLGIGQQIIGLFFKFLTVTAYVYVFTHWKFLTIGADWTFNTPLDFLPETNRGTYILVFILLFIGVDFLYYWFHRLSHEVNFLWAAHVVHHQSEEYNLSVALRQSWLQDNFSWAFYLPLAFLGFPPEMFFTAKALDTLYQFWIHTKFVKKMPLGLEHILMTPSHHRVHHGSNPKYIDKNHGGTFIIWDKMFGTFQAEEEEVVYGITTPVKSWNPVWVNAEYWVELFNTASKTTQFIDKIKVFLMPPGWFPKELGGFKAAPEVSPERFVKYDSTVYKTLGIYTFFQFLLCLAYSAYFLNVYQIYHYSQVQIISFSAYILLTLLVLGGIFDKQKWVIAGEYIRLLSSVLLVLILVDFNFSILPYWFMGILAFILITSVIWYSSQVKWITSEK